MDMTVAVSVNLIVAESIGRKLKTIPMSDDKSIFLKYYESSKRFASPNRSTATSHFSTERSEIVAGFSIVRNNAPLLNVSVMYWKQIVDVRHYEGYFYMPW